MLSVADVERKYNNKEYNTSAPYPDFPSYRDDYVFDEELSVKRNRELVIEHNNKRREMIRAYREDQNRCTKQLINDSVEAVANDNLNFFKSRDKAINISRKIVDYVWEESHATMSDYFSNLNEISDLVGSILQDL